MKKILFAFVCFLATYGFTQDFYYKNYDWKDTPEEFQLTDDEKKLDEVILKYKKTIHVVQTEQLTYEYHLTHKIMKLNTHKGIERNNKYYIANGGSIEVKMQKARVISPSGKINYLFEKDILDSKDEDGNVNYQYFAFEGVELGSVIEYIDLVVYPVNLKGSYFNVQGSSQKKNVDIEIISPQHMEYLTYPINGLANFIKDTTILFQQRLSLHLDKVEALDEESWSTWDANIQKVYYKFNKNLNSGKANFYTYSNIAKDVHERYFGAISKKEKSDLTKFLKGAKVAEISDLEQKVRALENYLKKEIVVIDQYFENGEDISFIVNKKVTSDNGFYKLAINCLRELGVDFELVLTCDRYEDKFITEYEAYNFLQEFLIYIKGLDKYMSHSILFRLGFPPENYVNNKGLFISEIRIGDLFTGVGKVKFINGPKQEESIDEINTVAKIEDDFVNTVVAIERKTTGYKAQPYLGVIDLINEDQRTEMKNEYLSYIDNETKPENSTFENDNSSSLGTKPFIGRGTIKSANFIEKAGENYLFKVGMLIGPQAQLYNEKKRVMPVEAGSPRTYVRKIEFVVPEGYSVKNPEVLQIDLQPDKTNNSMGFTSSYSIEGNKVIVTIKEWYANYNYPVSEYLNYEAVINASADFNKLVLVLQKM